jgi:hypothetical protein
VKVISRESSVVDCIKQIPCSQLLDWSTEDVKRWLKDLEMADIAEQVRETNLTGHQLLTLSSDEILDVLQIGEYSFLVNLNLS